MPSPLVKGCPPQTIKQPSGGKHWMFTRKYEKDYLFDTITFDAAATGLFRTYQAYAVPQGIAGKTAQDTNMTEAYKLPSGESYKITSMMWLPVTNDITLAEMLSLTYWSVLVFIIDGVDYFEIPMGYIGSGGGVKITQPPFANVAFTQNYYNHSNVNGRNTYNNRFKLLIPSNREFWFEVRVGREGQALSDSTKIRLWLGGVRKTPAVYTG